jgi:hypothetical protein
MKWRMDMKKTRLVMVLLLLGAVTAHAQTPFFQGKTIRIVTWHPAGDVNDTWPRLKGHLKIEREESTTGREVV